MSNIIKETKNVIVIENLYVKIEISKKDSSVLSVTDKTSGKSIMGDSTRFFALYSIDGPVSLKPVDYRNGVTPDVKIVDDRVKSEITMKSVEYSDSVFTLDTELGRMSVKAEVYDDFFSLEVQDKLPEGAYSFVFGNVKFDYDIEDENDVRVANVAMTVNTKPFFYPDGESKETMAETFEHLGGAMGAKIGITVVPAKLLREALKSLCSRIDRNKGLVSKGAGPWSRENPQSFGDYIIADEVSPETFPKKLEFYKTIGVDQIDYHQGRNTFRQGDFEYAHYKDHADFKKNVSDVLEANGMQAGLHTYAFYIHHECYGILSNPKWQQQLDRDEEFTLAEDVSADADFFPTVESTAELSDYYGFFTRNLPYFLIGEEIVKYTNHPQGFATCERGAGGTKPVAHKKGEKIYHLIGCFFKFAPAAGSELFKEIAHIIADTYNKGGFKMIYLDALDGMSRHCGPGETWYYYALFINEICKNCEIDPIVEYSALNPSIWAVRARNGAWDSPYRSYKNFNMTHHEQHKFFTRCHYASTLGWYDYYPITDHYPGNQHTRYHHTDAIDHMGSLAIMYNYSTAFNGLTPRLLERYEGYRRNIQRYKMYSSLRKSNYFDEKTLEKARASKYEIAVLDKGRGEYALVEKDYRIRRLFDALDQNRSIAHFNNPFEKQTPFVRIEADLSTDGALPMVLLPLNKNYYIKDQIKKHEFGCELDLTKQLAMKVSVFGNGKKGSIGIKTRCASESEYGFGLYVIDTDFEGWRDFVLCEADNGTRLELGFEENEHTFAIYRSGLNCNRLTSIEVMVSGDVDGVFMSDVIACRHMYDVIKNPEILIGEDRLTFECEMKSTDFIEFDGKSAKVIDRYANERPIYFTGKLEAPHGEFDARFIARSLNNLPVNIHLTLGMTGNEIK